MSIHPLTRLDYPDPDVIRVGDVYYMVSTTMHFFPGGEILSSRDLVNWAHCAYVYDRLDGTPGQRLDGAHIYGQGMWAASLRHHEGTFYVCFVCNDTRKTYLYTAKEITGPWEKRPIEGFYHDCSLLFDEDGRVYIAHGNCDVRVTELKSALSGPKEGGVDCVAVSDAGNPYLGYEGSHFYRIGGKYCLFLIHSRRDRWRRTEACFVADRPEGPYVGGDVLDDDLGYCHQGVAQGGIVDTPDGRWFAVLFQDRGAVGRIPVLVPVTWREGFPVFGVDGRVPEDFPRPGAVPCAPLMGSDDFREAALRPWWQFNHEPDRTLTCLSDGAWTLTTDRTAEDVTWAKNILTQRMRWPACAAEVTVDGSRMKAGDIAGLCALQGLYGMIGLMRTEDGFRVTMRTREASDDTLQAPAQRPPEQVWTSLPYGGTTVRFRLEADFTNMRDEVRFLYRADDASPWVQAGPWHKVYFKMDHFVGCRFGLYLYATKEAGGSASFRHFVYE